MLSTALGLVVPGLISRHTIARCAGVLYTFFGCRLMYIGYKADPNETAAAEFEELEVPISTHPCPAPHASHAPSGCCVLQPSMGPEPPCVGGCENVVGGRGVRTSAFWPTIWAASSQWWRAREVCLTTQRRHPQGKMTLDAAPPKGRVRRYMSRICTPIFMEARPPFPLSRRRARTQHLH